MPDRSRHASNDSGSSHCDDGVVSSIVYLFALMPGLFDGNVNTCYAGLYYRIKQISEQRSETNISLNI